MTATVLRTQIQEKLGQRSAIEVLTSMGYAKASLLNLERFDAVLSGPHFGLDSGDFDFRYSDQQFLRALCACLEIDMTLVDQVIDEVAEWLEEERDAFKPYLWVDTEFQRTTQPLFALAACESHRYLEVGDDAWHLSEIEKLEAAKHVVVKHVQETSGKLSIWGEIKRYKLFCSESKVYLLDLNGDVIGETSEDVPNRAALQL